MARTRGNPGKYESNCDGVDCQGQVIWSTLGAVVEDDIADIFHPPGGSGYLQENIRSII